MPDPGGGPGIAARVFLGRRVSLAPCCYSHLTYMAAGLRKVGDYVTRKIAGETIVVPIRSQAAELDFVYVLNEVGATIWSRLDEGLAPAEIAAAIANDFEVDPDTARQDVDRFLETLLGAGVIEGQVA